ncbi:hypothetical protein D7B24_004246 [Verticillium nonalfalfae]|uniref:Secreted protein n=1 Tax=Verticillium nonalfalfae TaxID=1051616 RepID=A0A3M9XVX6_9PEZI|nr:uncharacterized protein D7B24_004246 [Verticillium nonalfalfae]RNJ52154.1 hypothetical protein D7B24_004246 [Verticillium nonalfalfae]
MMNILAHLALFSLGNVAVRASPQAYNEHEPPSTVTVTTRALLCCHLKFRPNIGHIHKLNCVALWPFIEPTIQHHQLGWIRFFYSSLYQHFRPFQFHDDDERSQQ